MRNGPSSSPLYPQPLARLRGAAGRRLQRPPAALPLPGLPLLIPQILSSGEPSGSPRRRPGQCPVGTIKPGRTRRACPTPPSPATAHGDAGPPGRQPGGHAAPRPCPSPRPGRHRERKLGTWKACPSVHPLLLPVTAPACPPPPPSLGADGGCSTNMLSTAPGAFPNV